MSDLQQNLRANLISTVTLFQSVDALKEFQTQVPYVFAPTELFCKWFDETYLPDSIEFLSAFSVAELNAIRTVNVSMEKLSGEAGDPPPSIEDLFALHAWTELEANAKKLLITLKS